MGEELTSEEIIAGIRKATLANCMVPVCCGTSYRNKGVQKVIGCNRIYMPSPLDIPDMKGVNPETGEEDVRKASDDEPFLHLHLKLQLTHLLVNCASSEYIPVHLSAGGPVYNFLKTIQNVSVVFFKCTQTIDKILMLFMQVILQLQLV